MIQSARSLRVAWLVLLMLACSLSASQGSAAQESSGQDAIGQAAKVQSGVVQQSGFEQAIAVTQTSMVKITGSGGLRGLEPYQSGVMISDDGYILTVWSYVLDTNSVLATLDSGQRLDAKLVGYDPRTEIAILKVDGGGFPFLNLESAVGPRPGDQVLAFSNLYGVATGNEPTSVLQGIVCAKTKLSGRRGASKSVYQGDVYIVDAMTNNPGAAGGIVTDHLGNPVGLIGKELRDAQTNSWLNFAIPFSELNQAIADIRSGKLIVQTDFNQRMPTEPMTAELLGFQLVPEVVRKTPPYIDRVVKDSAAAEQGLRPDDLIIDVNGRMSPTCRDVHKLLGTVDRDSMIQLTVQRGRKFLEVKLRLIR